MTELVTLARPYAKAAFEFAKSEELTDSWFNYLTLSASIACQPEIAGVFNSPNKDNAQLVAILAGDEVDTGYKNFITLMADNNRLGLLPQVVVVYKAIKEQDAHSLSANVYSAQELDAQQLQAIQQSLTKRTGKQVNLSQHIDTTLLSGARVVAGDLVIDGSLKAKLEKLKTQLLN